MCGQYRCVICCSQRGRSRKGAIRICSKHVVNSPFGPDFRHRLEAAEGSKASLRSCHTESSLPATAPRRSHQPSSLVSAAKAFGSFELVSRLSKESQFCREFSLLVQEGGSPKAVLERNCFRNGSGNDTLLVRMYSPSRETVTKESPFFCV